jgi:excinuclease ABC subunit A
LAGTVWQQCRAGLVNPFDFGDSPTDRGMAPIRYALLHDFDALNKIELVGFDAWHHLIDKPEEEVTETDRALLDEIAKLTTQPNIPLDELQSLYQQCEYGQAIQERLAESINKE